MVNVSKPATAAAADDVERVLALLSDPSTEDEGIVQAAELLGYQPDADDDADAVAASLALLLDYPEMMSRGNGKQGTNQLIAQADALLKQAGAGGKALRTTPPAAPPAKRADVPAIPNDGTRKERWDAAAEGAIPSGSKSPLVKAEHLGGGMVRKDGVISPPSIARRLARTRRVAALVGAGVDVKRACEVAGLGRGWIAKALRAYRDYLDGEPIADTDANYDLLRAGELVERTYSFAALMRDFPDQSLLTAFGGPTSYRLSWRGKPATTPAVIAPMPGLTTSLRSALPNASRRPSYRRSR